MPRGGPVHAGDGVCPSSHHDLCLALSHRHDHQRHRQGEGGESSALVACVHERMHDVSAVYCIELQYTQHTYMSTNNCAVANLAKVYT